MTRITFKNFIAITIAAIVFIAVAADYYAFISAFVCAERITVAGIYYKYYMLVPERGSSEVMEYMRKKGISTKHILLPEIFRFPIQISVILQKPP